MWNHQILHLMWPTMYVYSHIGYDLFSELQSALIEVRKNGRKCRIGRLWVEI